MAKQLGKKGSEGDMVMYNARRDEDVLVCLEPSRYPERLQSLAFTLSMSDVAILKADLFTRELGEQIVALDAFGIKRGFFILGESVGEGDFKKIVHSTVVENYTRFDGDIATLREKLFEMNAEPNLTEPVRVDISHHFKVKGVGTVILGSVAHGTLRQHDELQIFPTKKKCSIRSIQVQDQDVKEAATGSRVGCALKNVEPEELDRGFVLAPASSCEKTQSIEGELIRSRFYKVPLEVGTVVHLVERLQFVPGRISAILDDRATVELEKPLVEGAVQFPKVVLNLDAPLPRIIGRMD